jgi:hypothetical protein
MSSDNIAIRVRGLGKKYTIGGSQENYLTLRDAIVNLVKVTFVYFSDMEHTMKPGFLR